MFKHKSLFFLECQTVSTSTGLLNRISSPTSLITNSVFNLSNPWCASSPVPQRILLIYTELVYLTHLRATSNSANLRIFLPTVQMNYQNTVGFNVSQLIYSMYTHDFFDLLHVVHIVCTVYSHMHDHN